MHVRGGSVAQRAEDGRGAIEDSGVEVAVAKSRQDFFLDDDAARRIGEPPFEAVADLDAGFAFVRRDDQDGAVVLTLLPDAPGAPELVAVVLDRMALQR